MSVISNGLSSGIQSLNNNVFVHTGRQCPTSWSELKSNISRNISTCAKACTAFLDSSLGMACSMGVFGLAAASVCLQEDLTGFIVATVQDNQSMSLCYNYGGQNHTQEESSDSWTATGFDVCNDRVTGNHTMFCSVVDRSHHHVVHGVSLPVCNSSLVEDVFIKFTEGVWVSAQHAICTSNTTIFANAHRHGHENQTSRFLNHTQCIPDYTISHFENDTTSHLDDSDGITSFGDDSDDVTTWDSDDIDNFENYTMNHFDNHTMSHIPVYCWSPREAADRCQSMTLAFGIGSALVLTATVGKIVYNKYMAKSLQKGCKSARKLPACTFSDGILLAASGLGTGVLAASLISPCGPIDAGTKKVMMTSTALYWSSAASSLLSHCITSPKTAGSTFYDSIDSEEDAADPVTDGEHEEEGLISSVSVDMESLQVSFMKTTAC
ncbi:hypothetical protein CLAVI_000595 [Candidatus Clavichlamydia salmonicola]|nr:hypothetical protein [Candidatus Clavichlamydia salmonicola]